MVFLLIPFCLLLANLAGLYIVALARVIPVDISDDAWTNLPTVYNGVTALIFILLMIGIIRCSQQSSERYRRLLFLASPLLIGILAGSSELLPTLASPLLPLDIVRDQILYVQVTLLGLFLGGLTAIILSAIQRPWAIRSSLENRDTWVPWLLAGSFSVVMLIITNIRYLRFEFPARDLGIFDQAIWHLSHFQMPASTIRDVSNLWADHFHPILILIAPLYWLWNDPRVLLFLQILITASAALPLYWLAREQLMSRLLATILVVLFLGSVPVQNALHFGFYPENLVVAFIIYLIYFLEKKHLYLASLMAFLMLLSKENIGLYLAAIGCYYFFSQHDRHVRKWGLSINIIGLIWTFVTVKFIIPFFAYQDGATDYVYFQARYGHLGQTPLEAIGNILFAPLNAWAYAVHDPLQVTTLLIHFLPTLLFPLFTPFILVLIPVLGESLLSGYYGQWGVLFHYAAPATPLLMISTIFGLKRFFQRFPRYPWAIVISIAMLTTTFGLHRIERTHLFRITTNGFQSPTETHNMIQDVVVAIPSDAHVLAQSGLVSHLSQRTAIYDETDFRPVIAPNDPFYRQIDYYMYARSVDTWPLTEEQIKQRIRDLIAQGYGIAYGNDAAIALSAAGRNSLPVSWQIYLEPALIPTIDDVSG